MRGLLLFITLSLVQFVQAQTLSCGESDLFWIPDDRGSINDELGCIRHYIGAKGESTFLVITLPSSRTALEISKNNNVYIKYTDGRYLKTQVHSVEVEKLSKTYAKEKLFATIIECPVNKEELCNGRIKRIEITQDCGAEHIIHIKNIWGRYLQQDMPYYFESAEKRAVKKKEKKEFLVSAFGGDIPHHIRLHLDEHYPNHSYSLIRLDTVHLPLRAIQALNHNIRKEGRALTDSIDAARSTNSDYTRLRHWGDSLVSAFKDDLQFFEYEYENPEVARGTGSDYQRVSIELKGYEECDTITLNTKVGSEKVSTIDFRKEAAKCHQKITELERVLDELYAPSEEK